MAFPDITANLAVEISGRLEKGSTAPAYPHQNPVFPG
jgi:hypothetical protein